MKRIALVILSSCLGTLPVWGQTPKSAPASQAATAAADARSPATSAADEFHEKCCQAFLKNDWKGLAKLLRGRHGLNLTAEQRSDLSYITDVARKCRPRWWKACRSTSNNSFRATIWGRSFVANYIPSEMLGIQAAVGIRRGKIVIIVSWQPNLVDNPRPLEGTLAEKHGFTKGDVGEVIVWHELGHNYVTNFLPLRHVIELYENHSMLFYHLQEFYADMTALYHCSPKARRLLLIFRLPAIERNRESDCHTRGALAMGSILLAEFLSHPEKWPSVHFPPEVPKRDIERMALMYVYTNLDKKWTVAEDRQLRSLAGKLIRGQGQRILRRKGQISLPNGLKVKLMEPDDREYQLERNDWVARQLNRLIDSGRADKPTKGKERTPASELIKVPF